MELLFESTRGLAQDQFGEWLEARSRWDLHHYQLLNGRVVMSPPAGYPHGAVASRVGYLLRGFVSSHEIGEVFSAGQGFELPSGDTVEIDASFVSNERLAPFGEPGYGELLRAVPDLAVEVLSAASTSLDRGEKKAIYEKNRVLEYWIVDPRARELTVYTLEQGRFGTGVTVGEGEEHRSRLLLGLTVQVSALFPPRR